MRSSLIRSSLIRSRPIRRIERVAGNGLLDRRALLGRGAALAGAVSVGAVGASTGAAAEPLAVDPWSLAPGVPIPPYGVPSRFEDKTVRILSNPKLEPRGSAARTPHHLLNGTITPNGLHFVVARGGFPDIDPAKHKLLIHGRVKQPTIFTLDALHALSDGVAGDVPRMRRQQRADVVEGADPGESCRRSTASCPAPNGPACGSRRCSKKPASIRSANWLLAEGADAPTMHR